MKGLVKEFKDFISRGNVIDMAVTVIFIGFSSYASVSIRAAANPPMNSNDPSTPHKLLSLSQTNCKG